MASSFSLPLNCDPLHKTLSQVGFPGWRSGGLKLQSSITSIKEVQPNLSNGLNRGSILSANRSYLIMSPLRYFSSPFSNHVDVSSSCSCSSSSCVIISGFWVGLEADDGWGFVDALVHEM